MCSIDLSRFCYINVLDRSSYVTTLNQNPPIGLRKSISRFSTPLIPFPKKDLPENAPGFTKSPLLALQKVSHSFTPHPHCKNHHGRGPSFMTTQDTLKFLQLPVVSSFLCTSDKNEGGH